MLLIKQNRRGVNTQGRWNKHALDLFKIVPISNAHLTHYSKSISLVIDSKNKDRIVANNTLNTLLMVILCVSKGGFLKKITDKWLKIQEGKFCTN